MIYIDKATGGLLLPPYWLKDQVVVRSNEELGKLDSSLFTGQTVHSVMPLAMRLSSESEWYTLPFEPLVSIARKNIVVRRSVQKADRNGTIKERWSQDDWEISITGVLISSDQEYPKQEVKRISEFFDAGKSIEVLSQLLLHFDIKLMAIESLSMPHTKGIENQTFEIKGYSDIQYQLLIEE